MPVGDKTKKPAYEMWRKGMALEGIQRKIKELADPAARRRHGDRPPACYVFSAAAPLSRVKPSRGAANAVNSVGMTNFVAGLAPSARSASRYCSVIVFASTVWAAS